MCIRPSESIGYTDESKLSIDDGVLGVTGKEAHNAHNGGRSAGGSTYGGGVGGGGTGMLGTGDCRMSTLLSDVSVRI